MSAGIKAQLLDVFLEKRPEIKRFLIARFRSVEFAEDILQETYLKIDRSSFDQPISNQNAYLYRIAHNLALDARKQTMRHQARDHDWHETKAIEAANDQEPEEKLDRQQKIKQIADELQKLPPQCRNVFKAHKFDGLSHREVAEKFNISRSTVEKHVSKALKHLIVAFQDSG